MIAVWTGLAAEASGAFTIPNGRFRGLDCLQRIKACRGLAGRHLQRSAASAESLQRRDLRPLGDPLSIEGDAYQQIFRAVAKTAEIIESVRVSTPDGLEEVKYPTAALHEIITNAVLHRDYSVTDDIHIRIFDNRVEVDSPGTLPGHVTPENILKERFARNPAMVRLINKFPNPPNKDVGEGLNTAFQAMRDLKLKPPIVSLEGGYVRILLRHEPLATPEDLVMEYRQNNEPIANSIARQICFIGSENKMKLILQRMVKNGYIELAPGTTRYTAAYRLVKKQ